MTRKDFLLISDAVRCARRDNTSGVGPRNDLSDHNRGVAWVARNLADALAHDNPRFDRERFLKACGVSNG